MRDGRQTRVLIVDDDPGVREFLRALLARDQISSTIAEDGQRAIEMLERETFDIILLDLLMPRVDGLGVLAHMRSHGIETPVIVISAVSDQLGDSLGPQPVRIAIQKPFDPGKLRSVVAAVIAESQHPETAAALQ